MNNRGGILKVLIIEDEPVIRYALVKMVSELDIDGFTPNLLTEVDYAENAIDYLNNNTYDIIFIDIEGGKLNGLELINQWREKCEDTQWIIVSGYDRFDYAQKAILYGVQEYLLKPITKKKIVASVKRSIEKVQIKKNNFIETNKIEKFILNLEESIWGLDVILVKSYINKWVQEMSTVYCSLDYYKDVIYYIFDTVCDRLERRGTILSSEIKWNIHTQKKAVVNQTLLNKCLELIDFIREERKGNEKDPIEIAKVYILQHIEKDISLEDVANKLGFNSSYFSQVFKRKTGQTFVKYRTSLRIEKAKEILLKHDVRIIDIPFMIGLNDHPHFTKTFKDYTGYTPSGYRKRMGIV